MTKLTTHCLDTFSGKPAKGVKVEIYSISGKKGKLNSITLNKDGRSDKPLLEGADFKEGFSITSLILKLSLLIFVRLKIPHLDTSFFFTFFDAITDELYFLCNLIIALVQFFFIIKSSDKSIKKYFDLRYFLHFKIASPVPLGFF